MGIFNAILGKHTTQKAYSTAQKDDKVDSSASNVVEIRPLSTREAFKVVLDDIENIFENDVPEIEGAINKNIILMDVSRLKIIYNYLSLLNKYFPYVNVSETKEYRKIKGFYFSDAHKFVENLLNNNTVYPYWVSKDLIWEKSQRNKREWDYIKEIIQAISNQDKEALSKYGFLAEVPKKDYVSEQHSLRPYKNSIFPVEKPNLGNSIDNLSLLDVGWGGSGLVVTFSAAISYAPETVLLTLLISTISVPIFNISRRYRKNKADYLIYKNRKNSDNVIESSVVSTKVHKKKTKSLSSKSTDSIQEIPLKNAKVLLVSMEKYVSSSHFRTLSTLLEKLSALYTNPLLTAEMKHGIDIFVENKFVGTLSVHSQSNFFDITPEDKKWMTQQLDEQIVVLEKELQRINNACVEGIKESIKIQSLYLMDSHSKESSSLDIDKD